MDQDNEKLLANITFQIDKGKQVYFERIQISGNTKTRDKVIRRELRVYEEELYGGQRLKRGIRNLNRLDYFRERQGRHRQGQRRRPHEDERRGDREEHGRLHRRRGLRHRGERLRHRLRSPSATCSAAARPWACAGCWAPRPSDTS
ncbi:MAG: hypothetical protein MZV70_07425 [Desulfobacterales bacterium]|nr:hypothetical protein [Desulfobacterales bacterium]